MIPRIARRHFNTRRHKRESVDWSAECRLDSDVLVGRVADISPGGAFFRPDEGNLEGVTYYDGSRVHSIGVGELLYLTYVPSDGPPATHLPAMVRWRGYSREHRCRGFGVEFM